MPTCVDDFLWLFLYRRRRLRGLVEGSAWRVFIGSSVSHAIPWIGR